MGISFKELKKNRLTPAEKWVLERIEGVKPLTNEYGYVEWHFKDGGWLFTQDFKNGRLWVSHNIWLVLLDDFGLKGDEIHELIKNVMYDYTNNGTLTPKYK